MTRSLKRNCTVRTLLDAASIAQIHRFDLAGEETQKKRKSNNKRMAARTWAITCWSEASSKE